MGIIPDREGGDPMHLGNQVFRRITTAVESGKRLAAKKPSDEVVRDVARRVRARVRDDGSESISTGPPPLLVPTRPGLARVGQSVVAPPTDVANNGQRLDSCFDWCSSSC